MGNKYVALLLVVCLMVGVGVEAIDLTQVEHDCYGYCYNGCVFYHHFCDWWCQGRCDRPILMGVSDGPTNYPSGGTQLGSHSHLPTMVEIVFYVHKKAINDKYLKA
ncbi:hypothetical protein JHK82_056429 [Glycine max]|nr:hypothetical protein JHK86_056261 [Glycine max]KAG4910403.1 hypothetical protein JHK87_056519 [Glycine soja]KAG4918987.1 hypothetical protein JHK85_057268 [Glycine max]KAG5075071.1 hypothetical protein JHK84_056302 [Glycine max]KAG5077734.1 hypothetical protein JHK82_056429 [Glycine max]